jgi:hypothetical protein
MNIPEVVIDSDKEVIETASLHRWALTDKLKKYIPLAINYRRRTGNLKNPIAVR